MNGAKAGFVDSICIQEQNADMNMYRRQSQDHTLRILLLITMVALLSEPIDAKEFNPDNPLNQPAAVYWCPGKMADQQIATKRSPGCQPLYDKHAEEVFRESLKEKGVDLPVREPIKILELQNAASQFTDRYRSFLSCCSTDTQTKVQLAELIDEANNILKSVQQKGIFNSAGFGVGSGSGGLGGGPGQSPKLGTFARQWTLSEIVGTVAHARDNLMSLEQRLNKLDAAQRNLETVDYESSGRARLEIHEQEEAIKKEFGSKMPASSAPTGMEIQDKTFRSRIGGDIEDTQLNPNFGADIGYSVSPYSNVGESLRPRRGDAIHDSELPYRPGTEGQDTTIPNSTGFQIDQSQNPDGSSTVQRRGIGPSIGDSDLNSKRR